MNGKARGVYNSLYEMQQAWEKNGKEDIEPHIKEYLSRIDAENDFSKIDDDLILQEEAECKKHKGSISPFVLPTRTSSAA